MTKFHHISKIKNEFILTREEVTSLFREGKSKNKGKNNFDFYEEVENGLYVHRLVDRNFGVLPEDYLKPNLKIDRSQFLMLQEFLIEGDYQPTPALFHRWKTRRSDPDNIYLVYCDDPTLEIVNLFMDMEDKCNIYDIDLKISGYLDRGRNRECIFLDGDSTLVSDSVGVLDMVKHQIPNPSSKRST